MDQELNSEQNSMFLKKKISEIIQDNEKDFNHTGINRLFNVSKEKSQEKYQLEELRYQRFMTAQELMMDRFSKLESNVAKIEGLLEDSQKTLRRTRFIEEKFWESKDFTHDDRVKKATYFAFFVLLAVAVGLLLPYFKSEKLVIVDNEKILTNMQTEQVVNKPVIEPAPVENKDIYVSTNWVHMRDTANPQGQKVYMLGPNQKVEKIDSKGEWFQIRLYDYVKKKSVKGWVFSEFLVKERS